MTPAFSLSSWFFGLLRRLLYLWVRTDVIGASRDQLGLDPDKPVCYVLQYSSLSSRLVLEQELLRHGLPSAQRTLGADKALRRSLFFLYNRQRGLFRRGRTPTLSPRMVSLVQHACRNPEQDVQIVPVSLFWGRSPDKEKSLLKILLSDTWSVAGRLQKFLIILIHGRNTFVQFNKPISLKQIADEFPDNEARAARKLARVLRVHFRRVRQAVLGPDLSHRRTLVHTLIRSTAVKNAINETARRDDLPPEQVRAKALAYADELVANMSMATIRFLEVVLGWLWTRLYNGINLHNIETVQEVARDNAVIYVPCHRSHIDYLLLSYVLYRNGLMPPHIAAGINLNMPVVGPILRRGGAFFMRRSFKNNPLYAAVFNEYMHVMFSRGYPVEYFVEGGRSRTGRTLSPKAGMLVMTLRSFLRDHSKPIVFQPVYIGYEKIIEARSYLGELQGKKKQNESIFGLIKSLRNLRNSFGKVALNFGEPIDLGALLDRVHPDWRREAYSEEHKPVWFNQAIEELSREVATRINQASAINPVNILAATLLSTERLAMDEHMLARTMDHLVDLAKALPYSPHVTFPDGTGQDWVRYGEQMGVVNRHRQQLGDIITLEGSNAILMTYYRNNILHLFAIPALVASLFQNNASLPRERVIWLISSIYPYIRAELFMHWDHEEVDGIIATWIDILVERQLLRVEGDRIQRPALGSDASLQLRILSRLVIQTLERYYISMAVLRKHGPGVVTPAELEEQSTLMAQRMSILFGLNAPEFFDKSLFRNFITHLQINGILHTNEAGKLEYSPGLDEVSEDARLVLSPEMRQAILQVTQLGLPASDQ